MSGLRTFVPTIAVAALVGMSGPNPMPPASVVTIVATDFEFAAPATVPAGLVTFKLINQGKQLHHANLVRLDEGKSLKDLGAAMSRPGPSPGWVRFVGGPNATEPGGEANATVVLRPGRYAWLCFIPDTDHTPHLAKGMIREFVVTAPAVNAELPAADISIQLSDYEFKLSKPVTAGRHTFRVRNYAAQDHEVELIRLAPGKTFDDLKAWLKNENSPPPGAGLGGVAILRQNTANNFTADFTPGEYALVCFVSDAKDGSPHFAHGMVLGFTVK